MFDKFIKYSDEKAKKHYDDLFKKINENYVATPIRYQIPTKLIGHTVTARQFKIAFDNGNSQGKTPMYLWAKIALGDPSKAPHGSFPNKYGVLSSILIPLSLEGKKNKIVFKCIIEGNSEIFIMNEDGSGQKNLTNSPNLDHQPSLSPDSEKIVYVSRETKYGDGDIWTMNPDGSEKKRLKKRIVDKHLPPLWSSDGNKIVFISREDIWTMNPDGSRKKRLTNNKKK